MALEHINDTWDGEAFGGGVPGTGFTGKRPESRGLKRRSGTNIAAARKSVYAIAATCALDDDLGWGARN